MARTKRGEGPNKMALVRDAIGVLGGDPKPKAIHDQIIAAGGITIPTGMISSYKSMILRKGKKKKGPGRPRKVDSMASAPSSSMMMGSPRNTGGSVSIDDISAVKGLVNKFGVGKLSDLIKLLAS